jgi:phosphonate transport system substrate-binding protein
MYRCISIVLACLFVACGSPTTASTQTPTTPAAPIDKSTWPAKLRIGMNAHLTKKNDPHAFDNLTQYLQTKLGIPVEITVAQNYEELAKLIMSHEVDVADLTPFNYVKVKEKDPKVQLLARQIATGASTFSAYFIARTESKISTLADLKGKRLALVDPLSTSGYLLPISSLLNMGIDPKKDLTFEFVGTHEGVIDAVRDKKFDAGAVWSGAFEVESIQGLEVFYKTERIPYDGYAARGDLPPSLSKAFQEALFALSTSTEEGRAILTPLPSHLNGFVSAEDKDYDGIRAVQAKVEAWNTADRD